MLVVANEPGPETGSAGHWPWLSISRCQEPRHVALLFLTCWLSAGRGESSHPEWDRRSRLGSDNAASILMGCVHDSPPLLAPTLQPLAEIVHVLDKLSPVLKLVFL